jgi:hypothetical protein
MKTSRIAMICGFFCSAKIIDGKVKVDAGPCVETGTGITGGRSSSCFKG